MNPIAARLRSRYATVALMAIGLTMLLISFIRLQPHASNYRVDLTNRLVGACLQQDGVSPYFYHWKEGDPVQHYDFLQVDTVVSNMTASPFFHRLLQPVCRLPFNEVAAGWFYLQYLLVLAMLALFFYQTRDWLLLALACFIVGVFSWSHWWNMNTMLGQYYLLFPFLGLMATVGLMSNDRWWQWVGLMGCAVFILMRPTAVIWVVFLLLAQPHFWKRFTAVTLLLILGMAVSASFEQVVPLWADYFHSLSLHADLILRYGGRQIVHAAGPEPAWLSVISDALSVEIERNESSNLVRLLFAVAPAFANKIFPFSLFVILTAAVLWRLFRYRHAMMPMQIILCGAVLYLLSDFFSTVFRNGYFGIQWLGPLFIGLWVAQSQQRKWFWYCLAPALLLILFHPFFIPLRLTMAEMILAGALFGLALMPVSAKPVELQKTGGFSTL